jgi:hypothetical protein
MEKNPFEIFGLTPEMAARLSEKDLFAVLKAMYRALQKTVHPDVSRSSGKEGRGERAVELNLAFEALNLERDPAAFRRYRKAFVARRPQSVHRRSQALERELALRAAREERLATAYLERLAADYGWGAAGHGGILAGAAVFPLKNVRLGLLDVAINQNLRQVSWSIGSNYKEMKFDARGLLSVRQVGRSGFSRAAFIHPVGSVPAEEVDLLPLLERPPARFFKSPALNAAIGANGPALSVLNRITAEKFKSHVLAHLKPMARERSYLFSLNRPEFEENGGVTLEGLIIKIEPDNKG